jgi:superfamily II DNA/RNA helicase
MDQMSRTATLDAFREGRITFLAASDVAARGLDIPDVSHIFNFDVPWQSDDYVHRIGRTGRAGKEGRSLTLVTPDDAKQLKDIERMLGAPVTWIGDPPSPEDLTGGRRGRGRGRGGRGARPPSSGGFEARGGRNGAHRPQRNGAASRPQRPRPQDAPSPANGHDQPQPALTTTDPTVHERPRRDRGEPRPQRREEAGLDSVAQARPAEERPRQGRGDRRPQRHEKSARPERQEGAQQPRQPKPPRQPWEARRRPDRGGADDGKPSPVGLGDHVPAFLRKTTRTAR